MIRGLLFILIFPVFLHAQNQPAQGYISTLNATVVFQKDSTIILSYQFLEDRMVALSSMNKQFALLLFDEKMNPADTFFLPEFAVENGMMLRKDPVSGKVYLRSGKGKISCFSAPEGKLREETYPLQKDIPLVDYTRFNSQWLGLTLTKGKNYQLGRIDSAGTSLLSVGFRKKARNAMSPDFYFTRNLFLYTNGEQLCVADIRNGNVYRFNRALTRTEQKMKPFPAAFQTFEIIDIMEDSFYFVISEVQKPKSLFKYTFSKGQYELLKIVNFKVAYNFRFFNGKLYFIAKVPGKYHGVYSVSF